MWELTDMLHASWLVTGRRISRGVPRGYAPWSQGGGLWPAREGEAGYFEGIWATVGRGKVKLFPLRVDLGRLTDTSRWNSFPRGRQATVLWMKLAAMGFQVATL
jgi:hypothetical protein